MDTKTFIDAILPRGGKRCIGALSKGEFRNFFGADNAWAAGLAQKLDTAGKDAYFALAGFDQDGSRKQANVVALGSFWLDLDVGAGPGKYASQREALQALVKFRQELRLPRPWVVDSGNGIHVYWPTEEDMTPDSWQKTAACLKKAAKVWGFHADPSRTCDSASVLRPVGTCNHKDKVNPKPVQLLGGGPYIDHAVFRVTLEKYLTTHNALPQETVENINSDLITKREFLPSDPNKIADACAVMGEIRATRGNVEEPVWHGGIGVLLATTGGAELVHEWSKGHPNYSKRETDAKIANWNAGPTTCERFSDFRTAACAACPHYGKIKSPIVLGVMGASSEPQPIPDAEPIEGTSSSFIEERKFPAGYGYAEFEGLKGSWLYKEVIEDVKNDEGNMVPLTKRVPITSMLIYPTARVEERAGVDASYAMHMTAIDEQGGRREFTLDYGILAEPTKLAVELSSREILVTNKNKQLLNDYINAWATKLRNENDATPRIKQFGWYDKNFIVGTDRLYSGGTGKAILTRGAASFGPTMGTAGDLDTWVSSVDKYYNHPGQEALQFCILSSFAAPLWRLFGVKGGVVVHAHSAGSGYGKSTAQKVGFSAWGLYADATLHAENFTENALNTVMGVMQNIPVVIDELTNAKPDFVSRLLYSVSEGQGKVRLNANSTLMDTLHWSTIALTSANALLTEKVATHRKNAQAEMMRIWEFTVRRKGQLGPNEALELDSLFQRNYGHAGRAFMAYVTANYDQVVKDLFANRRKLNTQFKMDDSAERYWSQLHACAFTALQICRKIGLLKFDEVRMMQWVSQELKLVREQVRDTVSTPEDQFAEMLAELHAGILRTKGEGNTRYSAHAEVMHPIPRGTIVGRHILPDAHTAERYYITVTAVRDWCASRGVSARDMHLTLVNLGWVSKDTDRVSLGKGTEEYSSVTGQVRCWEIKPSAIRAVVGTSPAAQKARVVLDGGSHDEDVVSAV